MPGRGAVRRPFHVVKWATRALDEVRRQAWNDARRRGQTRSRPRQPRGHWHSSRLKNARYALWKNPDNTERQRDKLAWIAKRTPACTAPTCSKKASGSSSRSRARPANTR